MIDNCPECGQAPGECYGICPMNDPYRGDQAREEEDYSFNARYDDVQERYGGEYESILVGEYPHEDDDPNAVEREERRNAIYATSPDDGDIPF
jgi:hypothetical protein